MRTSLATLGATAAISSLVGYACSSTTSPTPVDAGITDGGVADAAPAVTGPCTQDTKRVAEDDSGVCCAGLFKACVNGSMEGVSPCICSTVACGTPTM